MKVAIVLPGPLSFRGGAEVWSVEVADRLRRKGWKVTFFLPEVSEEDVRIARDHGVKAYKSLIYNFLKHINKLNFFPPMIPYNRELDNFDIVYTTSMQPIRILMKCKTKLIVGTHDAFLSNRKLGIDSFQTISRLAMRVSGAMLSVHALSKVVEGKFNLPKERFFTVPNFIPGAKCNVMDTNEFRIVFLGRVEKRKGADVLIKISNLFKEKPGFYIDIAGSVPQSYIPIMNSLSKVSNIRVLGRVGEYEKFKILQNSSLLIFLSSRDVFPFVMLEALSCGLPIVTTWKFAKASFQTYGITECKPNVTDIESEIRKHHKKWSQDRGNYFDVKKRIQSEAFRKYDKEKIMESILDMFIKGCERGSE
ncbi:hypothetical protein IX51_03910 [uncultured archaeon]|nr:hypothetical protein IX51_03910 [uncultured archaeon]